MQDALDTTYEITKLIKKSPARDAIFKRLKVEMASDCSGIRVLCPTRWTVRAEALKSILDNFNVLLELWDESLERGKDTEMKARIRGVAAQMQTFSLVSPLVCWSYNTQIILADLCRNKIYRQQKVNTQQL